MERRTERLLVGSILFVVASLTLVSPSSACQVCVERTLVTIPRDYCSVQSSGVTQCREEVFGLYRYCYESGNYCDDVTVIGQSPAPGSSGGCSYDAGGFCPASCQSCSGSGGSGGGGMPTATTPAESDQ